MLSALLQPPAAGGSVTNVWDLLACLDARQLRALTARSAFYDLPHTDGPPGGALAAAAIDAMLQV